MATKDQKRFFSEFSKFTPEKQNSIISKLDDIGMLINSIECDLHDTPLEHHSLLGLLTAPSLWCYTYGLKMKLSLSINK